MVYEQSTMGAMLATKLNAAFANLTDAQLQLRALCDVVAQNSDEQRVLEDVAQADRVVTVAIGVVLRALRVNAKL